MPTLEHTLKIEHHKSLVGALAVARNHLVVAIHGHGEGLSGLESLPCTFQVFKLHEGGNAPTYMQSVSMGHDGSVSAMLFVDSRLVEFGTDASLHMWDFL